MWHKQYDACVVCGGVDSRHIAKGRCKRCYGAAYRNNPANKSRIEAAKTKWRERNLEEVLKRGKELRELRHFDGKREDVLKRDNYRCQRCGKQKASNQMTVHHKNRKGRGTAKPDNRISNLETVCRSCHLAEHRQEVLAARESKRDKSPKLLLSGRWSRKHEACIDCQTTVRKHISGGRCSMCHGRNYKKKMT